MSTLSFISTPFPTLLTLPSPKFCSAHSRKISLIYFTANAIKTPRGFGPVSKKPKTKNTRKRKEEEDDNEEEEEEEEERDAVIPEIVTNRMMKRMGLSVGIPLSVGLSFFPFFYYLKVIAKIDIPNWVPFIVSFIFFGTALAGVSYGIVSASWDPLREGSVLGWNEARKNWPVFWQSLRGGAMVRSSGRKAGFPSISFRFRHWPERNLLKISLRFIYSPLVQLRHKWKQHSEKLRKVGNRNSRAKRGRGIVFLGRSSKEGNRESF